MNTPHSKRGGHRAGAGRTVNPLGPRVRRCISLPDPLWDRLGPRKSQTIAQLIIDHTPPMKIEAERKDYQSKL